MAMYRECPLCGSNLDPGETCDCRIEKAKKESKVKLISIIKDRKDREPEEKAS